MITPLRVSRRHSRAGFLAKVLQPACCGLLGLVVVGCQPAAGPPAGRLPAVLERIGRTYPDCAGGRFLALADFENAEQARLFRIVETGGAGAAESTPEQPSISIIRNRSETGAGGLKAPLRSSRDVLLLDGQRTEQLALIRDWSAHHLLLMSVFAPESSATLAFTVDSGAAAAEAPSDEEAPGRWSTTARLRPGWNLLRYDLAAVAERADLSDVRRLSWRVVDAAGPVELYLDDLIVTDNTRYQSGAQAAAGEMIAYTRGRRTLFGALGRFEIGAVDGVLAVIAGEAGQNLALPGGFGPLPLPLPAGWAAQRANPPAPDDPAAFNAWGGSIGTLQRIVEAGPQRVVVRTERRFMAGSEAAEGGQAAADAAPGHVWEYVAYPDGRVFTRIISDPAGRPWPQPQLGYALCLDGRRGLQRERPAGSARSSAPDRFVLFARSAADQTDVLWIPHQPDLAAQQLELASADDRQLAVIAGDLPATGRIETAHLLVFWPRDLDGPTAASLAADYQRPARVDVLAGRLRTDVDGDRNADGFNESQGCYEIELAGHVARLRFDPQELLRHRPIFRVHGSAGRKAWIYADGRIIGGQWSDAADTLMFMLPRTAASPVSIEINCGEP